MRFLFSILFLVGPAAGATSAPLPPYVSLDQEVRLLLGRNLTYRLFRRGEVGTLRLLRERHSLALIYETHPFGAHNARRVRERLRAYDVADEIAVLTRDELDFADLLMKSVLNVRAKNFLSEHQPRTLEELRATDLSGLNDGDEYSKTAKTQLRAIIENCERALKPYYQPRT